MYSPGLNFSREIPPIRSTYQSTPPPWHSHNSLLLFFFFFRSNRSHLNKLHFFEGPSPAENYTFSQKPLPTGLKIKKIKKKKTTTKNNNKRKKKNTASPPPPARIYSALPSKPPPHIFSSGTTLSCCGVQECVCVCVCLNIFSETTGPPEAKFHVEPPWDRGRKFIQMVQVICCSSSLLSTSGGGGF